ncbi:conserved hypothetical protein [Coccidioides posadasii str. Silveira]|uniref:Uncharacterized protein n=1 Tax=Coccidioides posadasii (strain RMSCC 757 / Silveira) TaxID=443226 RepID=E9DGV0_COCPS|nr:conserved hypothetical protein [Coccidioides posadasii str. Silveira]
MRPQGWFDPQVRSACLPSVLQREVARYRFREVPINALTPRAAPAPLNSSVSFESRLSPYPCDMIRSNSLSQMRDAVDIVDGEKMAGFGYVHRWLPRKRKKGERIARRQDIEGWTRQQLPLFPPPCRHQTFLRHPFEHGVLHDLFHVAYDTYFMGLKK